MNSNKIQMTDLTEAEYALLKAEESRSKAIKRWDAKIAALRAEVSKTCQHKKVVEFKWDSDDGYGHWYNGVGHRCLLCGKQNKWPRVGGSPRDWYDPIS